eukprot:gene19601-26284_t
MFAESNYASFEARAMMQQQPPPQQKQQQVQAPIQQQQQIPPGFVLAPSQVPTYAMPTCRPSPPSFLDKMFAKKQDLMKLIVLALAVLLAILTYHLIVKAIKHALVQHAWTEQKEISVTLLAIVGTLVLMWVTKTNISEDRSA